MFLFSSRRRHTRSLRDWSSDVCSSDFPDGPDLRPDPAVGPDRERVQDALREHPRQRGRCRLGLQRGDREVPARRRGEGGRRAAGPVGGVVAPTTLQPPPEARSARVLPSRAGRPRRPNRRRNWFAYGLIAPAVTFMVLVHLLPTAGGVLLSFK